MGLRNRRSLVALAVVVVAAGATAAAFGLTRGGQRDAGIDLAARLPKGANVDKFQADPDQRDAATGHGNLGSPASYEEQQLQALAYPSHTISAQKENAVRNAFAHLRGGRASYPAASWRLVGPTTSTEPAVLNTFDGYLWSYGPGYPFNTDTGFAQNDFQVSGRDTAMAVDTNNCDASTCRIWVAAAGGGIWRNDNVLDPSSTWTFVSGAFLSNNIGTLVYDAKHHALYAGTGEPNISADSGAGVGIYVSHNLGSTWTRLPGSVSTMTNRAVASIALTSDPRTFYVGTARAVHGVTGTTGGAVSLTPGAPQVGLYKTTDGGKTFTLVWGGMTTTGTGTDPNLPGTYRGVNKVQIDSHGTIYAASLGEGIWRSADGGANWEQIFATQDWGNNAARTEFALADVGGATRIYVGDGGSDFYDANGNFTGTDTGVYRADNIDTTAASALTDGNGGANPGYASLTSSDPTSPQYGTYDYCEGQCWYDNFVYSPPGYPNMVYVGGSFDYGAWDVYGGRAVLLSSDAGNSWTDQSTSDDGVVGLHPDQHAFATDPANPLLWFEGSDGGVTYSSGSDVNDASSWCANTDYFYAGSGYDTACDNLHAATPTSIYTANAGLSTLQFQGVAVNPNPTACDAGHYTCASPGAQIIGGTQDNGTWLGWQNDPSWWQTMYGDGGIPAFDAPGGNGNFMLNEFYDQSTDANFAGGDPTAWVVVGAPMYDSGESSEFYKPQIADTVHPGTFFVGLQSVWRTQDYGGDRSSLEANCQEFTTYANQSGCGDFVALGSTNGAGGPGNHGDLTSSAWGDKSGSVISALARSYDSGTLWAATGTGRLFISTNASTPHASSVQFIRLDTDSTPNRSISGIVTDPSNPDRAWVSFDGFNASTPTTPGHVFQVVYNPGTGTATWTDLDQNSGPSGDLPVTSLARDNSTGTLFAGTDFTVLASKQGRNGSYTGRWYPAAAGMPMVEVPWVTVDQTHHVLYAATHGRGIWQLSLSGGGAG